MNKFRHMMMVKSFSTTKPAPVRMSNSEAFVETLVANNVNSCFGIVGSAFMDALDLFPNAGIRFVPVVCFLSYSCSLSQPQ
jgi:sulfoacetaldehyde acetyltransferase